MNYIQKEKEYTISVEKGPEEKTRMYCQEKSLVDVTEENVKEIPDKVSEANSTDLKDEINPTDISSNVPDEAKANDLFKIEGEYKNPKLKPWTAVNPEKEFKTFWELIKSDNENKGIEKIGAGTATFELCFEFCELGG